MNKTFPNLHSIHWKIKKRSKNDGKKNGLMKDFKTIPLLIGY
jgi:hypothetical protein